MNLLNSKPVPLQLVGQGLLEPGARVPRRLENLHRGSVVGVTSYMVLVFLAKLIVSAPFAVAKTIVPSIAGSETVCLLLCVCLLM